MEIVYLISSFLFFLSGVIGFIYTMKLFPYQMKTFDGQKEVKIDEKNEKLIERVHALETRQADCLTVNITNQKMIIKILLTILCFMIGCVIGFLIKDIKDL
ncbi:MAG: hypothetical protein Ta2B_05490 [Termitinemataceae bacterium]|nr:MAG: hypothetical protein Ta2B_05490 [Termitinemataceae bacterium]